MLVDCGLIFAGLVLLFFGGEALVRGSVAIAERFGFSKMIIGLVIVGFGTSVPELVVSLNAALAGTPEIAIGNVIGSNIANVLLIVGLASLILPITGWQRSAVREALIATLAGLALFGLVQGETIGRVEGFTLLVVLAAYLFATYWLESREMQKTVFEAETEEFEDIKISSGWLSALLVVGGIAVLVLGADFLVRGAVSLARDFGVTDAVIGLTLVAIGTSLPELATAVVAAYRRHSDVVIGNVIGSNIFNVLAILGATTLIQPIAVSDQFQTVDALVMVASSAFLLALLFATRRIGRVWGVLMLGAYAGYIVYLFQTGTVG